MIDRKFKFVAVNPCKGNYYTEENAVLFVAKDRALIPALLAYVAECKTIGANAEHIESVDLLIDRVREYQRNIECAIPDTDTPCEIDRCIGGKDL